MNSRPPFFNIATLIVGLAVLAHLTYGGSILYDVTSANASDIKPTADVIGPYAAATLYFLAAFGALYGSTGQPNLLKCAACILQQLLLFASAGGASWCIYHGRFADNTVRTVAFLANDKVLVVGLTTLHFGAMIWLIIHSDFSKLMEKLRM